MVANLILLYSLKTCLSFEPGNIFLQGQTSDPKRVMSYNKIKMCMCVDVWWIYMVANLILLYSLKTCLSFEPGNIFLQENMGYLIHLSFFFSGGHLSTHCFKYL
jgi:hypothetical protein